MIILYILAAISIIFLIAAVLSEEAVDILLGLFVLAIILAIIFFAIAGIVWLICWGFNLAFTWKAVLCIWIIVVVILIIR